MHIRYFCTGALLILICAKCADTPFPQKEDIYLRPAYDPARVTYAIVQDSVAGPMARRLVADLLTRDLYVQIEHTGRCIAIKKRYEAQSAKHEGFLDRVRPVSLFRDETGQCFSYTVHYSVPLAKPVPWKYGLLTDVPLRLGIIHPQHDFGHFEDSPAKPQSQAEILVP